VKALDNESSVAFREHFAVLIILKTCKSPPSCHCLQRLEQSVAVERLERLERADPVISSTVIAAGCDVVSAPSYSIRKVRAMARNRIGNQLNSEI
jgi:hypothetical protein